MDWGRGLISFISKRFIFELFWLQLSLIILINPPLKRRVGGHPRSFKMRCCLCVSCGMLVLTLAVLLLSLIVALQLEDPAKSEPERTFQDFPRRLESNFSVEDFRVQFVEPGLPVVIEFDTDAANKGCQLCDELLNSTCSRRPVKVVPGLASEFVDGILGNA